MNATQTPNYRFWIYYKNSPVKLTIRPQQTIEIFEGGATEEGYDWTVNVYHHTGDELLRESTREARDCDGPLTQHTDCICTPDKLHSHEFDGVKYPDWDRVKSWQRDIYAEQMGY